jgi:predicted dehydrogenase
MVEPTQLRIQNDTTLLEKRLVIKLLILGLEHMHALQYIECLKHMADVRVAAVAEAGNRRLSAASESLHSTPVYTDYRKMLSEVPADGAIVCSANAKHKDMVKDCARVGIPILCEKPIATKTTDAREMLAVCQAHEVPLGMCFPARFSEGLSQAKHLIGQGGMGKVLAVKATNHGTMPGDWFVDPELAGGGAIMDHTVHVVDALRWLFEAEFTQVFAHASNRLHNLGVEDTGLLSLEMSNEVIVTLDTSWSRPNRSYPIWGDVSFTIVGTRGVLNLELFPWTLNHYSEEAGKHLVISQDGDLNRLLLGNFIGALSSRTTLMPDGVDGLRALEVVEAAYQSVASGTVVTL